MWSVAHYVAACLRDINFDTYRSSVAHAAALPAAPHRNWTVVKICFAGTAEAKCGTILLYSGSVMHKYSMLIVSEPAQARNSMYDSGNSHNVKINLQTVPQSFLYSFSSLCQDWR